jgi:hypothetical protein
VNFNITGNSNPSLFAVAPTVSSAGTLSYTPAANANGSATITLVAQDNGGTANGGVDTSAPQSFTITVAAVNDAPSFTKGADQTVNEDAGAQTVAGWATAISAGPADEAGQTVNFNITGNSNPSLFAVAPTVSSTGMLRYTPAANANGSATIMLVARDDGSTANGGVDTSAPQSFTIIVVAVNDAPSFTKGADQMASQGAGAQTVLGWATGISAGPADEGGQIVTFNITGNSNPSLFATAPAVSPAGTLTYTPAPSANGSATITLVARDNGGTANGGLDTSAPQTFTVTVTPSDAPVFIVHPLSRTVVEGKSTTLFAAASGTPAPSYQWYFNSNPIGGATATSLPISFFQKVHEGNYELVATNTVGAVTSEVATVYAADPLRFVSNSVSGGNFSFRLVGRATSNFVLETSSRLSSWGPLATIPAPSGIVDGSLPVSATRYFRARLLP